MRRVFSGFWNLVWTVGVFVTLVAPSAAGGSQEALANLQSKDRETCLKAVRGLDVKALTDKGVQMALLKLLTQIDEEIGRETALALAKVGKPMVEDICTQLAHEDEAVRYRCLVALAAIGAPAGSARSLVLRMAKDDDEDVRAEAIFASMKTARDEEVDRAILVGMIDPSKVVRFSAWQSASEVGMRIYPVLEKRVMDGVTSPPFFAAIGEIVEKNKGKKNIQPIARLVPKVAALLVSPEFPYHSRWSAWRILSNFHAESVPLLLKSLRQVELPHRDDCAAVLRIVAKELKKRGENEPMQKAIFEAMRDRLTDPDNLVAQSANNYFFENSERARGAEAQYRTLLLHSDRMRRDWARNRLDSWGLKPANEAWEKYQAAKGDDQIRAAFEWCLIAGGLEVKQGIDGLLQKNINHPKLDVRYEIVRVLYPEEYVREPLRAEDQLPVASLLMQRIKLKDAEVRYDALRKLVKYQLSRKEFGPDLIPLLSDRHTGIRYYACEAMKPCVAAEPKKYVPLLVKMLDDSHKPLHWSAAKSLSAGGKDALDALLGRLRKPSPANYWICQELPAIGEPARKALPLLLELALAKWKIDFQPAARQAVAKIDESFAAKGASIALAKNPNFPNFPVANNWRDINVALLKMAATDDSFKATQVLEAWTHFLWYFHLNVSDPTADPTPIWNKLLPVLKKSVTVKEAEERRRTVLTIANFLEARHQAGGWTAPWSAIQKDIDQMLESRRFDEDLIVRRNVRKALRNDTAKFYGV